MAHAVDFFAFPNSVEFHIRAESQPLKIYHHENQIKKYQKSASLTWRLHQGTPKIALLHMTERASLSTHTKTKDMLFYSPKANKKCLRNALQGNETPPIPRMMREG